MGKKAVQRIGHYEEFLCKLPDRTQLREVRTALKSGKGLSPEQSKVLEDALTAFSYYRHVALTKPAISARFNPILASLLGGMIAEITRCEVAKMKSKSVPAKDTEETAD